MEPKPRKSTAALQARPYAKFAYQTAKDSFSVSEWEEKLNLVAQLVKHPDIDHILRDPRLGTEDIKHIMVAVYDKLELNDTQRLFVDQLIEDKKMSLAPWIFDAFVKERKKDEGIEDVMVWSATPLTQAQQENLTESLRNKFNIRAEPVFKTDPDLISGIRIEIGDRVIDQSTKGYQQRLKNPPGRKAA
jgi:F-type H+-transporting ATPase subunit delta